MAQGAHAGAYDPLALLYMAMVFAGALLVPALIARFVFRHGPSDESDDGGSGGGGGGGLRRPPSPPNAPMGGLPLDHSVPARVRLRDARRLADRLPPRDRRPAREPGRQPTRRPVRRRTPAA
jgi:hypothetical protein